VVWHHELSFILINYSLRFEQQLYMAAGENENEGSTMGSSVSGSLSLAEPVACAGSSSPLLCSDAILREGQQSEQLCVVCHYFPLSRALLPCRHTCICAICFCKYLAAGTISFSLDKEILLCREGTFGPSRFMNIHRGAAKSPLVMLMIMTNSTA
jgi:hypothetical protein